MDVYLFGCVGLRAQGVEAPGEVTLVGLMGQLTTVDGAAPQSLIVAQGQMEANQHSMLAVHPEDLLLFVLTGAAMIAVGQETTNLIADTTVRVPRQTPFHLSTERSVGMTGLLVTPWAESPGSAAAVSTYPARIVDRLLAVGEARLMDQRSLDIFGSLTRLTSEGAIIATPTMVRGNFHRDLILASLLPTYAANPKALRALVWAINAHPAARWWLDHKHAQRSIGESVGKLLTQ